MLCKPWRAAVYITREMIGCLQDVTASSSSEPKRSIFAREFYHSAGLIDSPTTMQLTNQKSAETSHDPITGTRRLPHW